MEMKNFEKEVNVTHKRSTLQRYQMYSAGVAKQAEKTKNNEKKEKK